MVEFGAGTEGVPGIVAFGAAAKLAREEMGQRTEHDRRLRDKFEAGVTVANNVEGSGADAEIELRAETDERLPILGKASQKLRIAEGREQSQILFDRNTPPYVDVEVGIAELVERGPQMVRVVRDVQEAEAAVRLRDRLL